MSDEIYDLAEPIEAYRCWRVIPKTEKQRLALGAISFGVPWTREMTALACMESGRMYAYMDEEAIPICDGPPCAGRRTSDLRPIGHGCGIYALNRLSQSLFSASYDCVLGKVLLGGKVWPHAEGYRAEKARIVGLYGPDTFARYDRYFDRRDMYPASLMAIGLASAYDVPVLELTEEEHADILDKAQTFWVQSRLGMR